MPDLQALHEQPASCNDLSTAGLPTKMEVLKIEY